jgi:hypothetical protein
MPDYRFFISYQREDQDKAQGVFDALKTAGHCPFLDVVDATPGVSITKQLQTYISRAHFLVLIVTHDPIRQSAWVQQELGYALACNVPVVPILFGSASRDLFAMIAGTCSLPVPDDAQLATVLGQQNWNHIWRARQNRERAIFEFETASYRRPLLLADAASEIQKGYGCVVLRQRSALTSFSLPTSLDDPNWKTVEDRHEYAKHWLLCQERIAVEDASSECRLIIDPEYFPHGYSAAVQKAKLNTFRDYLAKAKDNKVRVVIRGFTPAEGLTILGNHWVLQSAAVGPCEAKRQTLSTWHAWTVEEYCKHFDEEFDGLWSEQKQRWKKGRLTSRSYTIARLDCAMDHVGCSCS